MLLFFIGSCFGSFLHVLSTRLLRQESVLAPPSHCENCRTRLRPVDLIPIISFLRLRGRCRYCRSKIPSSIFWIEVVSGISLLLLHQRYSGSQLLFVFLLCLMGLSLSLTDLYEQVIPAELLFGFAILLVITKLVVYGTGNLPLASGTLIMISAATIWLLAKASFGSGDLLLIGVWAFLLSGYQMIQLLFIASSAGLLFHSCYFLRTKTRFTEPLPFVPFLTCGLYVVLLFL